MNRRPILNALLLLAVYLLLWAVVPHMTFLSRIRSPVAFALVIFLGTSLFIAVQVAFVRWMAAIEVRPYVSLLGLLMFLSGFGLLVWLVSRPLVSRAPYWMLQTMKITKAQFDHMPPLVKYLSAFSAGGGAWSLAAAILIMLAAISLGCSLSFLLREKNIVLPVAVFAAYTDFWTVMWGPTSKMLQKAPDVVTAVSTAIPAPGAGRIQPISFIGPGDFVFMAMFFAALSRLKMEPSKTYWLLFPMMSIGMFLVLLGVFKAGLPALIVVAIAVVVANRTHFRLQRQELIATVVVALVLVTSAVVAYPYLTQGR